MHDAQLRLFVWMVVRACTQMLVVSVVLGVAAAWNGTLNVSTRFLPAHDQQLFLLERRNYLAKMRVIPWEKASPRLQELATVSTCPFWRTSVDGCPELKWIDTCIHTSAGRTH